MSALLEMTPQTVPCGPDVFRRQVLAGDADRVAAFVFDLETLFDGRQFDITLARAAARELARRLGRDSLWLEVQVVQLLRGKDAADPGLLYELAGVGSDEVTRAAVRSVEPSAEVGLVLDGIHRRFKLALVSTRPPEHTRQILQALGLQGSFDVVVDSSQHDGQPAELCLTAAQLLAEPPDQCVLVAPVGGRALLAATCAGMRTVMLGQADTEVAGGLLLESLELVEGLAAGAAAKYEPTDEAFAPDANLVWIS